MKKIITYLFLAAFCINSQANVVYSNELVADMKGIFHLPKTLFVHDDKEIAKITEKVTPVVNKTMNETIDANVSLSDFIRSYPFGYSETLISTLVTLADIKAVELNSYSSSRGEIKAKLSNGKQLYILISPSNDKLTYVRVTPTDGIYDIPAKFLDTFFKFLSLELIKTKNS